MRIGAAPTERFWFEYAHYNTSVRFKALNTRQQAAVEQIRSDGYLRIPQAIDAEGIDVLNTAIDAWAEKHIAALAANKNPDGTFPRLIGLHDAIPAIAALLCHENVLWIQDLLGGSRLARCTSITFLQGSQQPLHRDIPIFRTLPGDLHFRIWIALEDATRDSGALFGIPRGHTIAVDRYSMVHRFFERFDAIPAQDPTRWQQRQLHLQQAYDAAGLRKEVFELSAGEMMVWHPRFPHGGMPVTNRRASRRAVVLHLSILSVFADAAWL